MVGILHLNLYIPGCRSLKEKRSAIKPLIHRLHREFNISIAEVNFQDIWDKAGIDCACIANDGIQCQKVLQSVVNFIPLHFGELEILEHKIEIV
jgi:uncharacterized protein YlxP (DUF503 family)